MVWIKFQEEYYKFEHSENVINWCQLGGGGGKILWYSNFLVMLSTLSLPESSNISKKFSNQVIKSSFSVITQSLGFSQTRRNWQ